MNVVDWTGIDVDRLRPLYEQERARWSADLGWDTASNWRQLEQARTTWGLPGLLAMDDAGRAHGWTYFLPHGDLLQVGGLAAETPEATTALLDGLLFACDARQASGVSCFMFDEAPGLAPALHQRHFDVEPYLYLARRLHPGESRRAGRDPGVDAGLRPALRGLRLTADVGRAGDLTSVAELLQESYSPNEARYMAPGHTSGAWEQYVRNLVEQTGLGTFSAPATCVVDGTNGLDAIVLVTTLSRETAHVAQVAVHPSRRGQGLAKHLIEHVAAFTGMQGFSSLTLLVSASNRVARRLYDRSGFTLRARFMAAHRPRVL